MQYFTGNNIPGTKKAMHKPDLTAKILLHIVYIKAFNVTLNSEKTKRI